jgi:hypothetical protein
MSDHPEHRNGFVNPSVKYEPTDLSLRAVLTFSAGLAVVLVLVSVGLYFMIPAVLGPTPAQEPLPSWRFRDTRGDELSHLPAPPELEAIARNAGPTGPGAPTRPIQDQVRDEEDHLKSYGWVDDKKETAFIPIEEAMKRMAAAPRRKP